MIDIINQVGKKAFSIEYAIKTWYDICDFKIDTLFHLSNLPEIKTMISGQPTICDGYTAYFDIANYIHCSIACGGMTQKQMCRTIVHEFEHVKQVHKKFKVWERGVENKVDKNLPIFLEFVKEGKRTCG